MRIDAIPIGYNPPHDINVVVEVPIGGEPVKYEMDKSSGHASALVEGLNMLSRRARRKREEARARVPVKR